MIKQARRRVGPGQFVQSDVFQAPFDDESFSVIMSWGLFHVIGTSEDLLRSFHRLMQPGATLSLYTLVSANRIVGNTALKILHRCHQAVPAESADHVRRVVGTHLSIESSYQHGNMLFLTARKPN